jgi:CelD/BcsL family acetyltransferase involved in cellulose biosynthesis
MTPAEVRVRKGPGVLAELGARLDDLHAATAAPIMARRPWLETWIRCFSDHEPWAVTVERDGALTGAALLARRRRSGLTEVLRLGHWATDHARFPATDSPSAAALAVAVIAEVKALRGPWQVHLGQLPVADPVVRALADGLRGAVLMPGDGSPLLRFTDDRSVAAYLSKNHRQNSRTAVNRMRKAGVTHAVQTTREAAEIEAAFPEIDAVRRRRDAEKGRTDKLVDSQYATFRRTVIRSLAARGEAELTTLRLDGELAAYNLALLDGGSYRLWDSRMSPAWERFYPGRLVLDESIERALGDPRFTEFDFMRGQLQYKLWIAKDVVPSETLVAWSAPLIRAAVHSASRLRGAVRSSLGAVRRRI